MKLRSAAGAVLGIALAVASPAPARTSAAPTSRRTESSMPTLSLTVTVLAERHAFGESLPVQVELENTGAAPVEIPDPRVGDEFEYVLTSRHDPRVERYLSRARAIDERHPLETAARPLALPGLQLAPGERRRYSADLCDYEVIPIPPGEYTLWVGYAGVRSASVGLTIVPQAVQPPAGSRR